MKYKVIAILIFLILGLTALKYLFDRDSPIDNINQIEELNFKNNALKQSNLSLSEEISALEEEVGCLSQKIQDTQQKVNQLQIEKDEKIHAIDHFDQHQLFQFFARFETDSAKLN